jgi:hypothetical protein
LVSTTIATVINNFLHAEGIIFLSDYLLTKYEMPVSSCRDGLPKFREMKFHSNLVHFVVHSTRDFVPSNGHNFLNPRPIEKMQAVF